MRRDSVASPGGRAFAGALLVVWFVSCSSSTSGTDPGTDPGTDVGTDAIQPSDTGQDVPEVDLPADLPADIPPEVATCTTDCGAMVPIPAGSFQMGCVAGALGSDCAADEKPAHAVDVPAFDIDATEVTTSLWSRCVAAGGCTLPNSSSDLCTYGKAGKDQFPVNCIEHDQAAAFCQWAGKRLCSEAEWEKAAVGTDGRKYPWGNDAATCTLAVLDENGLGCGTGAPFAVGSKPAGNTPLGLEDMAGNVWEWVADTYHDTYDNAPVDGSPWMIPATQSQVARGGAFSDQAPLMRSSVRRSFDLHLDGYYLGVRCCRSGET